MNHRNDTGDRTDDNSITLPELKQTACVVQSRRRDDEWDIEVHETHAVFSTIAIANEAARRSFNAGDLGFEPVTKAELAKAVAAWSETGQKKWIVGADVDYRIIGYVKFPVKIEFQVSGAVGIGLGMKAAEGEELEVWVRSVGVDEDMPDDVDEEREKRHGS